MTLRRAPVQIKYAIDNVALEHVNEIRDLGVIIDTKLTFGPHVDGIVRRGNRALGLMIRSFQTGTNGSRFNRSAVMAAYFANVRSILEYGSVIWTGAAKTHTVRVDRVQHKFLMWLQSHTASGHCPSLSYPDLLNHFKIPTLSSRRIQHDLMFIRNIFRCRLNSLALLACFSLHVPARPTRTPNVFYILTL